MNSRMKCHTTMKMNASSKTVLIAVIIFCSVVSSFAWLRRHFSDEEIVSRAELIIIGKIKEDSIVLIPHDSKNGQSWEHHVTLLVSEVLKGQVSSNSMIVSIHYGLDPGAGARHVDVPWSRCAFTNDAVEIFDTGNSEMNFSPLTGDIRTNHIWLLRRESKPSNFDTDWIGIYDPEDIQPISMKEELLKHLK